jgi:hypothetical protein
MIEEPIRRTAPGESRTADHLSINRNQETNPATAGQTRSSNIGDQRLGGAAATAIAPKIRANSSQICAIAVPMGNSKIDAQDAAAMQVKLLARQGD